MTEILAIGADEATSADIAVAAGETLRVVLRDDDGDLDASDDPATLASIWMKVAAGEYVRIGNLTAAQPTLPLPGPGEFQLRREAGGRFGIFGEAPPPP